MQNIAEKIIAKLGGAPIVAKIIDIDVSQVYRWTYPKQRGGTGGLVPSWHQQPLLDWAKNNNIDLSHADFFEIRTLKHKSSKQPLQLPASP